MKSNRVYKSRMRRFGGKMICIMIVWSMIGYNEKSLAKYNGRAQLGTYRRLF